MGYSIIWDSPQNYAQGKNGNSENIFSHKLKKNITFDKVKHMYFNKNTKF